MKNIWKWIIGGIVVLVVVAGLVGLGLVMHNHMLAVFSQRVTLHAPPPPNGEKVAPPGKFGERVPFRMGPMKGLRMGWHGFGRGFRGFGPFGPGLMFFGLLGRLVPIAILLLLLTIAYRLGKGKAPVVPAAAPPSEALPAAIPTHLCPKCGEPVQDGWKHCPNCGEAQ